jgi:hypothetical protein
LIPFITSKQGKIERISVFQYRYSQKLKRNIDQFQKFKNWLSRNPDIYLYEVDLEGFTTFFPMREEITWQYKSSKSKEISAPFINNQQISTYLGALIRDVFSEKYERFLNQNIFLTDCISLVPFNIKKCIEFNIEFFEDGSFFVHFHPVSKIIGYQPASLSYIRELKRNFQKEVDNLIVSIVDLKTYHRQKIEIFNIDDNKHLEEFLEKHTDPIVTFDYHFLASYSPSIFNQIVQNTINDVDESILYLEKIILSVSFPDWFNFQSKPFLKITVDELGNSANLIIGENKCVNKQSATYYSGIFKPADNCVIQPVLIDKYPYNSLFSELIQKFNKDAVNFTILNPIQLQSNTSPDLTHILERMQALSDKRFLLCIFTNHSLSPDFFMPFSKKKLQFQTYQGSFEKYKLSNFAIKSLDKLGGTICVIHNTFENENTYFLGIDLGHSQNKEERFSNLGVTFFNHNGILIKRFVNKKIRKDESITPESILPAFSAFKTYLNEHKKKMPSKLIIHRDGKLHNRDIENIVNQAKEQLETEDIDIVEIIKNGFPVIAGFEKKDGAYFNLNSGSCWIHCLKKYAILITNVQSTEKNAIVNPLIIKHRYGKTDFKQLITQLYWFTKIYTNNLYNSTRLPATTQKANNLVGTGKIRHASYLG